MNFKQVLLKSNLVINNEYLDKYFALILKNKNNNVENKNSIYHKHHIIPKYYYKNNNLKVDSTKDNLVLLSLSDHILAHYYLIYCAKTDSFALSNIHAFNILFRKQGHNLSEAELKNKLTEVLENINNIEKLRCEKTANIAKIKNSGGKYVNKNGVVKHIKVEELNQYLAEGWSLGNPNAAVYSCLNKKRINNGVKTKMVRVDELNTYLDNGWTLGGLSLSEEIKEKISKNTKNHKCNTKGKIGVTKDNINMFIYPEELDKYTANGWKVGSKPRKKIVSTLYKGRVWVHKDTITKHILKSELNYYLSIGFIIGRGSRKEE